MMLQCAGNRKSDTYTIPDYGVDICYLAYNVLGIGTWLYGQVVWLTVCSYYTSLVDVTLIDTKLWQFKLVPL